MRGRNRLLPVALLCAALIGCSSGGEASGPADASLPDQAIQALPEEPQALGAQERPTALGETRTVALGMVGDQRDIEWMTRVKEGINALLEMEDTALRLDFQVYTQHTFHTPGQGYTYGARDIMLRENSDQPGLMLLELDDLFDHMVEFGALSDLTEQMPLFPMLDATLPQDARPIATRNGRLYCYPIIKDYDGGSSGLSAIEIRTDILEALGLAVPATLEELEAASAACIEVWREDESWPYNLYGDLVTPPYALHRTYEEWPFYVDRQSIFIYYLDGTIEPYLTSPVFEKDAAHYARMLQSGCLWLDEAPGEGITYMSQFALAALPPRAVGFASHGEGAGTEPIDGIPRAYIHLDPHKPNIRLSAMATHAIFVPGRADSVEDSLRMLQFLYADRAVNDILSYGIEGTDWRLGEGGGAQILQDNFRADMLRHQLAARPMLDRAVGTAAIDFPAAGFVYQDDPNSAWRGISFGDVYRLRAGRLEGETAQDLLARLSERGFLAMLESYRAQYAAYLAQRGWTPPM